MKQTILKNELTFERSNNRLDCYYKLKAKLSRNREEKREHLWSNCEKTVNELVLHNTPYKTRRTFIGLGTEDKVEYAYVKAEDIHIV